MRMQLDLCGNLKQKEPGENSIWMWYEWADTILEYAEEKIILTLDPSSFLILDEWKPVRCIKDKDLNIN